MKSRIISAILIPAFLLAGCVNGKAPTINQIANDVALEATGLAPVVAALATTPGVDPLVLAQAQTYLAKIQADAKLMAGATAVPATGTVQEIEQAVQGVAAIAGTIPTLAPYAVVVEAAVALLPMILQQAGITTTAAMAHPVMSATSARSVLTLSANGE